MTGSVATMAALVGSVFWNIWPPMETEEPPPPPPPVQQSLKSVRDAACTRSQGNGNIFGQTAHARGEATMPDMTPELARAAAAAQIAQDPATARRILAPYLGDATGTQAKLARLQLAYALLRDAQDQSEPIIDLLNPPSAFAPFSDAHYIRALIASRNGKTPDAMAHLESALELNPRFYNALMLKTTLEMQQIDRAFRSNKQCLPMVNDTVDVLLEVANLGACPLQLGHFRLAIARALPNSKTAQRNELLSAIDLALAYATQKDSHHAKLLTSYAELPQTQALCRDAVRSHGFGHAPE